MPVQANSAQATGNSPSNILLLIGGLFGALEVCAFIMGFFARKTKSGKAAMIVAGLWLIFALLATLGLV